MRVWEMHVKEGYYCFPLGKNMTRHDEWSTTDLFLRSLHARLRLPDHRDYELESWCGWELSKIETGVKLSAVNHVTTSQSQATVSSYVEEGRQYFSFMCNVWAAVRKDPEVGFVSLRGNNGSLHPPWLLASKTKLRRKVDGGDFNNVLKTRFWSLLTKKWTKKASDRSGPDCTVLS